MRELLKLARFSASKQLKETLNFALDNDKKRLAYHLSDGKKTTREIASAVGLSFPTVAELWKDWFLLGLGETVSASGGSRFVKSFDLRTYGILVPALPQPVPKASATGGGEQ